MNLIYRTFFSLAIGVGLSLAQGPHGSPGSGGYGSGAQGSGIAMNQLQTVTGPVSAVNIGYGLQYPSITINKLQIKIAPIWYLLDKSFEIKPNDDLTVVCARSTVPSDPYSYAVEMTNNSTKAHIVLRDSNGVPLWIRGPGSGAMGYGSGPTSNGDCTEIQSIATETGVVEQITAGVGIQMPSLHLKTAAGKLLVIRLGPERRLEEADFELKAGDTVTIKYAVTSHDDELIALTISKGGVTIILRGDDGRPAWN